MTKKEMKRQLRKLRKELKESEEVIDHLLCENIELNESNIRLSEQGE